MDINAVIDISLAFLANTILLMGLAVIYSIFPLRQNIDNITRKVIVGLVGGVIGISIMASSYELSPGLVFDARAVAMLTIGMFLGTVPALIAGTFMILFRIYIGGAGMYTGILWVIVAGGLGMLFRHIRLKPNERKQITTSWIELYVFSFAVQVIMVLLLFTLPREIASGVVMDVAIPILIIYPVGGLLVSLFMLNQRQKYFLNLATFRSEKQYRNLFSKSRAMQFLLETNGNIVDINEQFIKTYGYTKDDIVTMNIKDINVLSKTEVNKELEAVVSNKKNFFQFQHKKKNGEIMDVEVHTGTILLENKEYILSTIIDVTKQLESKRKFFDADEKLKAIFQSVTEGLAVTDENGHITLINSKAKEILGSKNKALGKRLWNVFRIYSATHKDKFSDIIMNALRGDKKFESDSSFSLITNDDDEKKSINFTVSPLTSSNNLNNGAILFIRDITLEKKRQDEITFISQHDFLTKLHNRYYFEGELKRLNTKRQLPISIILGDVNGLKLVNDTFNHLEGDNLLIEVSDILKKACRYEDIVARWGGDEFVILLPQTSSTNAQLIYDRIKDLCAKSDYSVIKPSISLGVATKTFEDKNIYDVLLEAETKMYKEKLQEKSSMLAMLLKTLEMTLDESGVETKEHIGRMLELSQKFGEHLNLSTDEISTISLLAKVHDLGKVAVSSDILLKTTTLSTKDWEHIHSHPETGSRLVSSIPELNHISNDVLHHHERWDGSGYPSKLIGGNIPFNSRLLSIVDAYEVMTSGRIHKKALSVEETLKELKKCKGTQFDPELTDEFIMMIKGLN